MTDLDRYRSAAALIDRFGAFACAEAASRADAHLECDDLDAAQAWMAIARAVNALQKIARSPEDTLH